MTMIIAEAGINFNGKLSLAKRFAEVAHYSGADAVKYQTFWGITHLKDYELTKEEWRELKAYCDNIGIEFMSTPHTMDAIHFIDNLGVIRHKIASPFLYYHNFLIEVTLKNKPILLSTGNNMSNDGMATLDEISNAINIIEQYSKNSLTLLQCVSKYPCNDSRLERIKELSKFGYPVGLSDHTKNIKIELRLPIIEKHIMLPDIKCIDENISLTPEEFERMVDYVKGN